MAAAPRQTVQRERDMSDRGEGTKPRERCGQNLQRDKGAHDHTREAGLAVVMRRRLRAPAAVLRQPGRLALVGKLWVQRATACHSLSPFG